VQATGKLYYLRLRVECTLFCNLQSWARTHAVLVIGLNELLGNPTTYLMTSFWNNQNQNIEKSNACNFKIIGILNTNQ
jgi:hypothetical protein